MYVYNVCVCVGVSGLWSGREWGDERERGGGECVLVEIETVLCLSLCKLLQCRSGPSHSACMRRVGAWTAPSTLYQRGTKLASVAERRAGAGGAGMNWEVRRGVRSSVVV